MSRHHHHVLLLPFILLSTPSVAKPINLIQRACKSSAASDPNINYDQCVTFLQAAPASLCANLTRLGLISLRLARDNAMDTRCYIKCLMIMGNKSDDDAAAGSPLTDCYELYSDSIPILRDAARDYTAKRLVDANFKVSSVMDDSVTCEDGFGEGGGDGRRRRSPLTDRNNVTFQLSAIALSIMAMLQA